MELASEISKLLISIIAIVGGAIAAYKAIHEMRHATKQRHQELRWKRAQAAREILHEIHIHKFAADAVTMLDWIDGKHVYQLPDGRSIELSYEDILNSLKKCVEECTGVTDVYIRDCIDWFLYHLDRVEHYIQTNYIDFIDVESVLRPYAKKIITDLGTYEAFMKYRGYTLASFFLSRYY